MTYCHRGRDAILLSCLCDGEELCLGQVQQRKVSRIDELEDDFQDVAMLGEIGGVGRARYEVLGERAVGHGAQVGAMDVEEDVVAGAKYDDTVIRRGN